MTYVAHLTRGRLSRSFAVLAVVLGISLTPLLVAEELDDPYEGINRKVFAFNEFADRWLLRPIAKGYRWVTPQFVDTGVTNVFGNLGELRNMLNAGLQGEARQAGISLARLLTNSTIGLAGFFDVASHMNLPQRTEDFGQTLGKWGVGTGPYVMLPFFGPSTLRDSFSLIPDTYSSPVTYVDHVPTRNTLVAIDTVDGRADLLDVEQLLTGDRYSFLRDVYLQTRAAAVANGVLEDDFDGDFDSEF